MKKLLFTLFIFLSVMTAGSEVWAQSTAYVVGGANISNLFMPVVAGVLLAIGFQMLLTILSVACGVSIFGNVQERLSNSRSNKDSGGNPGITISSGLGLWTMMTTSLSLFFASLLAVKLGLISNNQIGVTLGLVIWAAFFIAMTYFEFHFARSILGGIMSTVFSGVKTSAQFLQDHMGKTPAEKTIEAIRAELVDVIEDPHITKALKQYAKNFQPAEFDWSKAKKELTKLLGDFEIKASMKDPSGLERETFISLAEKHAHLSKDDVAKLGEMYDQVKEAGKAPGTGSEKVLNALEKLAPGPDDDSRQIREKFENYLRSSEVEALNPESLKEDLDKIVSDPKSTKQVVLNRIKQFDHPTIVQIVAKKTNMSQEEANQVVNRVESVLASIKEKATKASDKVDSAGQSIAHPKEQIQSLKNSVEDKIRNYFKALERPEFDYEKIKSDFEQIFHDPKASVDILKSRLQTYDRASLTALIASWPNVSGEDAERIVSKIEEARNNILRKAEEMEEKVKAKSQEAKQAALRQAENVRQSVMISAWWLLATAALSAFASALGGVLALS
jgi:hypothetical protein